MSESAIRRAAGSCESLIGRGYQHGFVTDIESDTVPPGPGRGRRAADLAQEERAGRSSPTGACKALRHWLHHARAALGAPEDRADRLPGASPTTPRPRPKTDGPKSLDEVDPKLLETYEKLGVPLHERARLAGVAVDAVFDSVSVATTFKERLRAAGVMFCPFSEAVRTHPQLIEQYLGSVVPYTDNFFATLNSAVFTDGSFVYVPKGVRCPMELSTYFRINAANTGQFERTLIIADDGSYVSYLEGCTAPMRDENQLHAAVVELVALDDAYIKYSTVQNWYPGRCQRRAAASTTSSPSAASAAAATRTSPGRRWRPARRSPGSTRAACCAATGSIGEFYSVATVNNYQQADTGTKMIHIGRNTRSTIVSKGISAGHGQNTYRGLVKMLPSAHGARNFTQCDSLLMGGNCGAHTFPYVEVKNPTATVEHEASTSQDQRRPAVLLPARAASPQEDAVNMIVSGFCKSVFKELPMEFAVEAQNLLAVSLEGAVG